MRISFICGSLAPGKDGVGDYTRRLAAELCRLGHECQLVSINDSESLPPQDFEGMEILRYRAPEARESRNEIDRWNPDWVSLQFVCFAFNSKGFIHAMCPMIEAIRCGRRMEIMFHELWVGEQPSLPFKHKVMGRIQQWQILSALKRWKPDCLHTSNPLYQDILERHGYRAERLPIFGNIAFSEQPVLGDRAENERILLFPFSQRHDWNVDEMLKKMKSMADACQLTLRLIQIGNLRSGSIHWSKIEAFAARQGWVCERLGAQPEPMVSAWMRAADIGISSTHILLADKSGAAVAMHEHGLPVICTITEPISKHFKAAPKPTDGLYSFFDSDETLCKLLKTPSKRPAQSRLPAVAAQWINDL